MTVVVQEMLSWRKKTSEFSFLRMFNRRNLVQIEILGGNWHFRWAWVFLGGT